MEISKYYKYTYILEETLKRQNKKNINPADINLITFVKNEKTKKWQMMFQVKHSQKTAKIKNLIHLGATILGNSRVIFYTLIYTLYKYLNPSMSENCYIDTDSMFWALGDRDLKNCVKPGLLNEFKIATKDMFVDPNSKITQDGKLKLEGVYN